MNAARLLRKLALILIATGIGVASGCARDGLARAPRDIVADVDACEFCHMAVDDATRAAQWVPVSGAALVFDEPGCLVAWLRRHPDATGTGWVADGETGEWIEAEAATYLAGSVRTGMGFDVVAYESRAAAAARLVDEGELIDWPELTRRGVSDAHAH